MQINSINSYNSKSSNKPAFGTMGKINTAGMTSLENDVILKNMNELKSITKDVYATIKLGLSDSGRYFDVIVTDLGRSGDGFRANPRTIMNENSPEENVTRALFNGVNRAREAYLNNNKSLISNVSKKTQGVDKSVEYRQADNIVSKTGGYFTPFPISPAPINKVADNVVSKSGGTFTVELI